MRKRADPCYALPGSRLEPGRDSRRAFEPPEDFLAADERRFPTELNGSNDGHVFQTSAEQTLALRQNFGDGGLKESFQSALLERGHVVNLVKKCRQVKPLDGSHIGKGAS
jgi:hypothetical protein